MVYPVRKEAISLRVDEDVLAWFSKAGPGYQSRMNAAPQLCRRDAKNAQSTEGEKGRITRASFTRNCPGILGPQGRRSR